MKVKQIKKIMKAFDRSSLDQLEITKGRFSLQLRKSHDSADFSDSHKVEIEHPEGCWIHSPLVGTFYIKTTADAEPMIRVGQRVKKNETVCIIETMKVFNEIKSPMDGMITCINVDDGCMVEYHQPIIQVSNDD